MNSRENERLGETNLRELIEEFRRSRTINEERMTIQKHRGYLRENMKQLDNEQRTNGILKLMWMNMLGYDTEFALVECMNSLFINSFKLKTIGYLGLTMFLSHKSEVLLMVTNRIRMDLEDQANDFVVSAALKTFSEIADDQMAQELFPILRNLLEHESKYVRKKVCLAIHRVLRQKPELAIDLKPSLRNLLKENNSGLLLCTMHLAKQALKLEPEEFHVIVSEAYGHLLSKLRKTAVKNSGNYIINGINDPFLQSSLMEFILDYVNLQKTKSLDNYEDIVSEFETCLLSVYNDTQEFGGSTSRSMLYQIARSIMQLPSTHALKKVGIAILGSFLQMKNKNYMFVSLKMLVFISKKHSEEVARHNAMIMRCVNDKDFSVKKLALEILLNTTNSENIQDVCELFFKELNKEKNPRKAAEMAHQNLKLILRAGSSRLEMIELTFQLLQSLDNSVKLNVSRLFPLFHLLANGTQTQLYACLRVLKLLGDPEMRKKQTLKFVGYWILGEFGEVITLGRDLKTSQRITSVSWGKLTQILLQETGNFNEEKLEVNMYILTALLKIFFKVNDLATKQQIVDWFLTLGRKSNNSISQKARQYLRLMKLSPTDLEEILESEGYTNENVEKDVAQVSEGEADLEILNKLAQDINEDIFYEEKTRPKNYGRGKMGQINQMDQLEGKKAEDMNRMAFEENNGLQNEEDEIEGLNLLDLELDIGAKPTRNNTNMPEYDIGLIGPQIEDDLDFLGGGGFTNSNNNKSNENDILGMKMEDSEPRNDLMGGGIDQMIQKELTEHKIEPVSEGSKNKKKKGLRKPKSKVVKKPKQNLIQNGNKNKNDIIDFDFLGEGEVKKSDPNSTTPNTYNNNLDMLDEIDLMNGTPHQGEAKKKIPDQNEFDTLDNINLMTETKVVLTDNYGALDDLDDVMIRGVAENKTPVLSSNPKSYLNSVGQQPTQQSSLGMAKDYDCLNINDNIDSLLNPSRPQMTLHLNSNNQLGQERKMIPNEDDFEDDDFVDCDVQTELATVKYVTFFENEEIRLEHVTSRFGLNSYKIVNYFSNKTGTSFSGLRLNVLVKNHVNLKRNVLSGTVLQGNSERGASLNLELEDSLGFGNPLKIKMMLKYEVQGVQRMHKFIVDNYSG